MEDYYLTSNIIINNNRFYYFNKENKILIRDCNLSKYYRKIGLNKLDKGWYYRIKQITNKTINNLFYINNIPDGNCFFRAISEAFMFDNLTKNIVIPICPSEIRKEISLMIDQEYFNHMMMIYRIEKENNEFKNLWNIEKVKTPEDLQIELCKEGNNYWADFLIIELFKKKYNLNIILLNNRDDSLKKNKYHINCLGDNLCKNKKTILLYFKDYTHFNLITLFINNSLKTIFKYDELPNYIINIYENDSRQNIF